MFRNVAALTFNLAVAVISKRGSHREERPPECILLGMPRASRDGFEQPNRRGILPGEEGVHTLCEYPLEGGLRIKSHEVVQPIPERDCKHGVRVAFRRCSAWRKRI